MATRSKWDQRKKKIMKENTFIAKKLKNIGKRKMASALKAG